jgi:hypothetical protein
VLGMLVSVASFLPIIIVGGISGLVGTTAVIFVMAIAVVVIGVVSVVTRGPLQATDARPASDPNAPDPFAAAFVPDRPSRTGPKTVGPVDPPTAAPAGDPQLPAVELAGPADPTDRD